MWKYCVLSHLIVCTCFPFSDIIRGVIDDVVAGFVVLPNRITVPLTDVDPYELKYPMPDVSECLLIVFTVFTLMRKLWKLPQVINDLFQGVLRIEVLEAKDLVKKDIGVFKKGSSDPYVILRGTVWFNLGLNSNSKSPIRDV